MADSVKPAEIRFAKGSCIILEGKPNGGRFYIIKEGTVQISRETDDVISEQKMAGPGEMFGVVSVLAARSYIETVVAMTDVIVFAVGRNLIIESIPVAVNIIKQFSQRLRNLNTVFSQRVLEGSNTDDPTQIFQIGEFYEKSGKPGQAVYAYQQYAAYCPNAENAAAVKAKIAKLKQRTTVSRPLYSRDVMIQKFPKNCLLFCEGENGHSLYIIQSGAVKVTKIQNKQEVVLEVINKGDILGEMAMLENKPRGATAEIVEDAVLLSVNKDNFSSLITEQPDMVIRLVNVMAERIWLRYRQLTNTLFENSLGRFYDALLIQLEKNRVDPTSAMPYQFNFSFRELVAMAGIPETKVNELFSKVTKARRVVEKDNKVTIPIVASILKEAEYYRRAKKTGIEN